MPRLAPDTAKESMQSPDKNPRFRRARGPERAGKLLSRQIQTATETRGFAVTRLLTHWAEIAGEDIARVARPVEMSYGRGFGATLTLLVPGAHAPVVEMQKDRLRERVNAIYGYSAVSRIRITQTSPQGFAEAQATYEPKPAEISPEVVEAAHRTVEGIGNDTLRDALEALGRNVLNTKKN